MKGLAIRDLVIVEKLNLEFKEGLTVLTGETGAGKSVIIEAICLALGKRADPSLIRQGSKKAEITAIFDIPHDGTAKVLLENHDLSDNACIVRRVIAEDGKSRAFCNDSPVTTGFLKKLSTFLIDVHAQQQSQLLAESYFQRNTLDLYGEIREILETVNHCFHKWKATKEKIDNLEEAGHQESRLELLEYQLDELISVNLTSEEISSIEENHKRLASVESNLGQYAQIRQHLSDEQKGASTSLDAALAALKKVELGKESRNLAIILEQTCDSVNEALKELTKAESAIQADPGLLQRTENRLSELHGLARKHACNIKELDKTISNLKDESSTLKKRSESMLLLEKELDDLSSEFYEEAKVLSKKRTESSKKMAAEVSNRLCQLGMPHANFEINIQPRKESKPIINGMDIISFCLATNPNQTPGLLAKVASGGELSRTSLAIQATISSRARIPTIVYDEVDSGIGGVTATTVGQNLQKVAQTCQVICITHSAQVASAGDHHYTIQKTVTNNKTVVAVEHLDGNEKEIEIARMLGTPSPKGLGVEHAKELIERFSRKKKSINL